MMTHSQGQLRVTGQLGGLDLDDDSQPRPVKSDGSFWRAGPG